MLAQPAAERGVTDTTLTFGLEEHANSFSTDEENLGFGLTFQKANLNVPGNHANGALGFCYYPAPTTAPEPGVAAYRAAMARFHAGRPRNRYSLYGYVCGRLVVEGVNASGRLRVRARERPLEGAQRLDRALDPPSAKAAARRHLIGESLPPAALAPGNLSAAPLLPCPSSREFRCE